MDNDRCAGHRHECTRRQTLKTIGGGLSTVPIIATAGCLNSVPALSHEIRYGEVGVPAGETHSYRDWVPVADESDGRWKPVVFTTPGEMGDETIGTRWSVPESVLKPQMDFTGIGYENYDAIIGVGPVVVGRGSIDTETVSQTLLNSGFDRAGEYDGYELFDRSDVPRTIAVADDAVVMGRPDSDRDDVTAVIDASSGQQTRYHETDTAFETITNAAGSHPMTIISAEPLTDIGSLSDAYHLNWGATNFTFDEEYLYHQFVLLFDEDDVPSEDAIRDELPNVEQALDAVAVEVTVDGSLAHVDIQQSHDSALEQRQDGEPPEYPQITWGVEDRDDEIAIRHEAGDTVDARQLTLRYNGPDETDSPSVQFETEFTTVDQGDSLSVPVSDRSGQNALALMYTPDGTESQTQLMRIDLDR